MQKVSSRIALAAVAALALGTIAVPALAHGGKGGGKKAMGTIASFDGTTLTVTTTDGETATATFTEDTKVKVEHRGHHARKGNPSNGSADSLTPGTYVLRMKTDDDGTLEKIRVRPTAFEHPAETPEATEGDETEGDETEGDETDETPAPEPDESETPDETPAPEATETPAA